MFKIHKGCKNSFVREVKRIVSRPIYAVLTIAIPLACYVFFSTFMPEGLPQEIPIAVIDHDNSALSRNIIRQIDATQQTSIVKHFSHYSEARDAMQKGEIFAFVEIPNHMERDVMRFSQPKIDFYYNDAYLVPGSLLLKDLSTMLTTVSAAANLKTRQSKGQSYDDSMGQILPISPQINAIGNPYVNYSIYLINVILPGLLQLLVIITTVYVIGVELKEKSSRKWIRLSEGSLTKALIGKLFPYTIIFSIMGVLCNVILFKFLCYPLHNNIMWMYLASFLLVLSAQAIGIFMIGVFPVLRDGLSFAGLYSMLAFSYSGLSFPIEGMPTLLQTLNYLFPLRYFFKIYQDIALNRLSPVTALPEYFILLLFLFLPLFIGSRLKKALIYQNYTRK